LPFLAYKRTVIPMHTRKVNGQTIKALRKALGITQDDLAISCDVTPGYLSNVEAGKKQCSETLMTALAARLGVPKDAISYVIYTHEPAAA
jgi:transcriptional regulator with XRE-family HTH domain